MEMPFSAPVAKEWVAKWGKQIGRHPLGTGPYVCDHWTASQDLLLTRNTNYTGTTAGYLDAINFQFSINPDDRRPQGARAATPTCSATTSRRPTTRA